MSRGVYMENKEEKNVLKCKHLYVNKCVYKCKLSKSKVGYNECMMCKKYEREES